MKETDLATVLTFHKIGCLESRRRCEFPAVQNPPVPSVLRPNSFSSLLWKFQQALGIHADSMEDTGFCNR